MVRLRRAPLNPRGAPAILVLPHHQRHSRAAGSCDGPMSAVNAGSLIAR